MAVSSPKRGVEGGRGESRGDRQWLTVRHIATRLDVSQDTVRRWIRARRLAATFLGGRAGYRVNVTALERFLRASPRR